jgi:predicted GNAT family N-acyltransferase
MNISITALKKTEISDFISVITEVYDEFVAIDYPEQGNMTFKSFIEHDAVLERMKKGNLVAVAKNGAQIIGAHEIRDRNHIALFFVKKEYQGKGTGRRLFEYSLNKIRERYPDIETITVNSSPYAEKIYGNLGFDKEGIKYIPMEYKIESRSTNLILNK